jgi:hypothetical protein
MTTPSQAALINAQQVYASLKSIKPELTNFFFNVGVEFGRKQALEEAAAKFSGLDIHYTLTAGTITNTIKELLK